jgi:hypothetical protein
LLDPEKKDAAPKDELQNMRKRPTALTRFLREPSGRASIARKPETSSSSTTPKLYTSLFLVSCKIEAEWVGNFRV